MQSDNESNQAAATTTPSDRSAEFRAVAGGGQTRSGTVLLVEAYAAIWLILFVMLWMGFRRQRRLDARIVELEKTLERARENP